MISKNIFNSMGFAGRLGKLGNVIGKINEDILKIKEDILKREALPVYYEKCPSYIDELQRYNQYEKGGIYFFGASDLPSEEFSVLIVSHAPDITDALIIGTPPCHGYIVQTLFGNCGNIKQRTGVREEIKTTPPLTFNPVVTKWSAWEKFERKAVL